MTRETKIGLLIGLGFIVVFAVLLSHTGTSGTAGDRLVVGTRSPVTQNTSGGSTPTNPGYVPTGTVRPTARSTVESTAAPATRPSNRIGLSEPTALPRRPREVGTGADQLVTLPLPEPKGLDNRVTPPLAVADGKQMTPWESLLRAKQDPAAGVTGVAVSPLPANLPQGRVAPARPEAVAIVEAAPSAPVKVEAPQPGARPVTPAIDPAASVTTVTTAVKTSPPDRQEAPKEYVVQKGDSLRKIAKDSYGVSSTKVVAFLVASNKGTIKNKDWIVEGQKLVVPPLPPEMFEGAGNIDVSGAGPAIRTVTSEELKKVLASPPGGQRTDLAVSLPADMLHKVDIASMAHSLEVRVPLLSTDVVDLATCLPIDHKLTGTTTKRILRDAFRDVLPEPILHRGKMGFEVPVGEFLRNELRPMFLDVVTPAALTDLGLEPATASELLDRHTQRRGEHTEILWALLVLCWWKRTAPPGR